MPEGGALLASVVALRRREGGNKLKRNVDKARAHVESESEMR